MSVTTNQAVQKYVGHYIESLENLPYALQRSFSMQRELDARTQDFFRRVEEEIQDGALQMSNDPNAINRLNQLSDILETCLSYSIAKERLAVDALNTMDDAVKLLNTDYQTYDNKVKEDQKAAKQRKRLAAKELELKNRQAKARKIAAIKKQKPKPTNPKPEAAPIKKSKTEVRVEANKEEAGSGLFCICKKNTYEAMLGCDSKENCPWEWFHLSCAGVKEVPKGDWYCRHCTKERAKEKEKEENKDKEKK